jgi:parallel beta-helix repeat protein
MLCAGDVPMADAITTPTRAEFYVAADGSDDAPGTKDRPWATINHAADVAESGTRVIIHGGHYGLRSQVRPRRSGRPEAWIEFVGYPGESAVLDAAGLQRPSPTALSNGAVQIEGVSFIRVANLTVINSHDAGFTIRDSSNIDLINNTTRGTFSSGIAVWDTDHKRTTTKNIRILANTVTRATIWDLAPPDERERSEPPHEAISIAGAVDFEVAYNLVSNSEKEGIDIKETSAHGRVHHNLVHHLRRQGIYVDAWFGQIDDIEIVANVVHDCHGSGIALSTENGTSIDGITLRGNLVFGNDGSGLYFSRWGANNARRNIAIANNVLHHNGYGKPAAGQDYYWQVGGIYLYSNNVYDISIVNNILSGNRGFQIGYSELFLEGGRSWSDVARELRIRITGNLLAGSNSPPPIRSGGNPGDQVMIYAINGDRYRLGDPRFKDPVEEDFRPQKGSLAFSGRRPAGVYRLDEAPDFWWKHDFPPAWVHLGRGGIVIDAD